MPCGLHMEKAAEQAEQLFAYPGWSDLPAVRDGRFYAQTQIPILRGLAREWLRERSFSPISFIPTYLNGTGPRSAFRKLGREMAPIHSHLSDIAAG